MSKNENLFKKGRVSMKFSSPKATRFLSGGALVILHICLPIILITFIIAAACCSDIWQYDPIMAQLLFCESAEYVLSSLFICLVGAIVLDFAERDRKMR